MTDSFRHAGTNRSEEEAVAVARHIEQAITEARVTNTPWPHVFVKDVWPETFVGRVYEALAKSDGLFKPQVHNGDRAVFHGLYENRDEFRINRHKNISGLDGTWSAFFDIVTSESFGECLRIKFAKLLDERLGAF